MKFFPSLSLLLLLLLGASGSILSTLTWATIRESIPLDIDRIDKIIHAPKHVVERLAQLCAREFKSCETIQSQRRVVDLEACYADALCRESYWETQTSWWQRVWYRKSAVLARDDLTGCTQSRGITDCEQLMRDPTAQHRIRIITTTTTKA